MKLSSAFLLTAVLSMFATIAKADISPMPEDSTVANTAAGIFKLDVLKIGSRVYKVVEMDSELNMDTTSTTIIIVGDGDVGGQGGYLGAFLLTPVGHASTLQSAQVVGNAIKVTLLDFNQKPIVKYVRYDDASKTLIEIKK